MPDCRKCGSHFPNWATVDGIHRCIKGRSYCLTCSPFGARKGYAIRKENTLEKHKCPEMGYKQCPICDKQFKYTKNNVCTGCRSWYQRYKRRLKGIELLGSKCCKCGTTDIDVLTFHHTRDKEFNLSTCWSHKNWEAILVEIQKCELQCYNCHMKHHKQEYNNAKFEKIKKYYDNSCQDI